MAKPIYFTGTTGSSEHFLPSVADKYIPLSSISATEKRQIFVLWLGIVYFNRTGQPARPDDGYPAEEDPIIVLDFHDDYEAGAWRKLDRGLTMEEAWFAFELSLGAQFMCVVNSAAPAQPMSLIERKMILDADATVETALAYFRRKEGSRRHHMPALVTDGVFGHCITLGDADPTGTRLAFFDPWPGHSLLCEENNAAGVKASPLGSSKLHLPGGQSIDIQLWQLSREELTRLVVALLIPMPEWRELAKRKLT